jgi:hypothetical protein
MNQTMKTLLLHKADEQADSILQEYPNARAYLEQTLAQEAEEKIQQNQRMQEEVKQKIAGYNQAVAGINRCLQAMKLDRHYQLPTIEESDLIVTPASTESEALDDSLESVSISE